MTTWEPWQDPWVDSVEHRTARDRTDEEQTAVETAEQRRGTAEEMAATARRHSDLPEGVDHAAELYPDDPERAQRHRDLMDLLRGSLAKQIARAEERR